MNRSLLTLIAVLIVLAQQAAAQSGPVVRFFGAVNQDGSPFCCEFTCRNTPTPGPEFDSQGRRVFLRDSGEFMLVAEAGVGTSGRPPGSEGVFDVNGVDGISDPSGRPSLQMLSSRALGNGSTAIDCRTLPLGGVAAMPNALNFPPGSDVTTALIDMACRFELETSSMSACTRDPYGNYAFIGGSRTSRQYCFQVPRIAEFPFGDTILALQFRDINGNLGPPQEIVIRVSPGTELIPSATPTASPTPTPTAAAVAGRIRYYSADRPVPGANVQLSDGVLRNSNTNSTGNY